ncbi:phage tail tape measure protein [Alcaligenaceae bacterium 429]|nr:phage tail tape measure protein [Alcaligenaceae bacterium 429]
MTQESRLSLVVDSRQAKPNVEELAKVMRLLEDAGIRATKSNAEVERSMNRMASQADAAASTIKRGLIAAFGGVSTMAIIDVADEWGQYASRIKMATSSTEEYEHVQKRMAQSAQTTFRAINETRESFIQMSPVLRDMGLSLDQSIDAVDTFSGLLVVNGANAQRGAAAMEALAKSLQRGRVDAQAWMTIYSTTDTVVDLLAKSMGKSADEVRRLGIEGKLSAKDMAKALVEGNREITAAVEGMPTTVRDAMQNLKTVFTEYIGWKNEASGATAAFAASLGLLGDNLDGVLNVGLVAGGSFLAAYSAKTTLALIETGKLTAAKIAEAAATKRAAIASEIFAKARLAEAQSAVASATGMQRLTLVQTQLIPAQKQLAVATNSLTVANRGLGASMLGLAGGPIGAITLATGLAASAFFYFQGSSEGATKALEEMTQPLDDVVGKFKELGRTQMAGKLVEYAEIVEESAEKAEGAFIRLLRDIETSDLPQFRTAKDGLFEMIEALNQAEKKGEELDAVINGMGSKLDIPQSVLNKWLVAAANFAEAQKKANDESEKLSAVKKLYEELGAAAQGSVSDLTNLNAAIGIEKWDEYLKKLTGVRDVIGLNARQLAEFQAAQAGANTVQKAMAGIVGAQADEYKKLQSAIEEKDKKAIEAAQNNIRALDIERQKVELLAIKTSALIAATNAFATGEVSGDVASGILQSILGGFDQAEAAIAVSKEAEAQIKNIFANTTSSTKGGAKAVNDYAAAMKSLLDTHLPENKALEDLKKNLSLLSDARKAGKVSVEDYDKALKSINETYANSLESTKKQTEMERILGDLREQRSVSQIQFMRELESFGQGDRIRELNADLAKVEDRYRSLIEARRNSAQGLSDSDLAAIKASQEKELQMVREFHDKKLAIQGDWKLGALDTLRNYADEAANVYDSIGNAMGNVFTGMEDALTQFVTKGKMDFKSLADSIIQDMVRIVIQQSITGPLAGMVGGWFGGGSAVVGKGLSGLTKLWSSGGYTGDGGKYEPAGIVHKGEGVLSADEIRAIGGETGFNALRRSILEKGHFSGGMAGNPRLATAPSQQGVVMPKIVIHNNGTPQEYSLQSVTRDEIVLIAEDAVTRKAPEVVARDLAGNNSRVGGGIAKKFNVTPNRR